MRFFRIPSFTGIETHRDDADRGSLRVVEGCLPHGPGGVRSGPVWEELGTVDLFSNNSNNILTGSDDGKGNSVVVASRAGDVHDMVVFSTENTALVSLGASYMVADSSVYNTDYADITPVGNRLYAFGDGSAESVFFGKGPVGGQTVIFPDQKLYSQEWSRFPNCKFFVQGPKKTLFGSGNPESPLTVYISEPAGMSNEHRDSPYSTELTNDFPGKLSTVNILSSDASRITALSTRGTQVVVHTDKGCHLLYAPSPDQATTGYRVEQAPTTNFSAAVNQQVVAGESGSQNFWLGFDGQIYKDEAAARGAEDKKRETDQSQASWKSKGLWEKHLLTDLSRSFATYEPETGNYWVFVETPEYLSFVAEEAPNPVLSLSVSVTPDAPGRPENLTISVDSVDAPNSPENLTISATVPDIPNAVENLSVSEVVPDAPEPVTNLSAVVNPPAAGPTDLSVGLIAPAAGPTGIVVAEGGPLSGPNNLNAVVQGVAKPAAGPTGITLDNMKPQAGPTGLTVAEQGPVAPAAGPVGLILDNMKPQAGPAGLILDNMKPQAGPTGLNAVNTSPPEILQPTISITSSSYDPVTENMLLKINVVPAVTQVANAYNTAFLLVQLFFDDWTGNGVLNHLDFQQGEDGATPPTELTLQNLTQNSSGHEFTVAFTHDPTKRQAVGFRPILAWRENGATVRSTMGQIIDYQYSLPGDPVNAPSAGPTGLNASLITSAPVAGPTGLTVGEFEWTQQLLDPYAVNDATMGMTGNFLPGLNSTTGSSVIDAFASTMECGEDLKDYYPKKLQLGASGTEKNQLLYGTNPACTVNGGTNPCMTGYFPEITDPDSGGRSKMVHHRVWAYDFREYYYAALGFTYMGKRVYNDFVPFSGGWQTPLTATHHSWRMMWDANTSGHTNSHWEVWIVFDHLGAVTQNAQPGYIAFRARVNDNTGAPVGTVVPMKKVNTYDQAMQTHNPFGSYQDFLAGTAVMYSVHFGTDFHDASFETSLMTAQGAQACSFGVGNRYYSHSTSLNGSCAQDLRAYARYDIPNMTVGGVSKIGQQVEQANGTLVEAYTTP